MIGICIWVGQQISRVTAVFTGQTITTDPAALAIQTEAATDLQAD